MSEVVICYSEEDETAKRSLESALQTCGIDVWSYPKQRGSVVINDEVGAQLMEAKAVIILWSATSTQSLWVKSEAMFVHDSLKEPRKLVPIRISELRPDAIPMPFNNIFTFSLAGWDGAHDDVELGKIVACLLEKGVQAHKGSPIQSWASFKEWFMEARVATLDRVSAFINEHRVTCVFGDQMSRDLFLSVLSDAMAQSATLGNVTFQVSYFKRMLQVINRHPDIYSTISRYGPLNAVLATIAYETMEQVLETGVPEIEEFVLQYFVAKFAIDGLPPRPAIKLTEIKQFGLHLLAYLDAELSNRGADDGREYIVVLPLDQLGKMFARDYEGEDEIDGRRLQEHVAAALRPVAMEPLAGKLRFLIAISGIPESGHMRNIARDSVIVPQPLISGEIASLFKFALDVDLTPEEARKAAAFTGGAYPFVLALLEAAGMIGPVPGIIEKAIVKIKQAVANCAAGSASVQEDSIATFINARRESIATGLQNLDYLEWRKCQSLAPQPWTERVERLVRKGVLQIRANRNEGEPNSLPEYDKVYFEPHSELARILLGSIESINSSQ